MGSLGLGITVEQKEGNGTEIWANNRLQNGLWKHMGWQMRFKTPLSKSIMTLLFNRPATHLLLTRVSLRTLSTDNQTDADN